MLIAFGCHGKFPRSAQFFLSTCFIWTICSIRFCVVLLLRSLYLSTSLSPFLGSASSFVCARLSSLINSISSTQSLIKINYNNRRKTRKIAFRRLLKRVFAADRGSSGRGQAKCQLIIFQPQLRRPRRRSR